MVIIQDVQDCVFAMKAGGVTECSDRINPGVPAKYPVAARCYAPGFH